MQEMMNDTEELTTEEIQPEEQKKSELDKLKEELSSVTYDDILERVHIKRASKIIANMMTERKMESSLS